MNTERFIQERRYLKNVTPRTVGWYGGSLKWLPCEHPTQADLKDMVLRMRTRGVSASGVNSVCRAVNAYLHRCHDPEGKCSAGCKHPKVTALKEPQNILPTFSAEQVALLVNFRGTNFYERLLHLLCLILLDTGCRITEALTLKAEDIDFENLLLTLDGKGRKQRIVPFSFRLRRVLLRYVADYGRADKLVLASGCETKLLRSNTLRYVKAFCKCLGFAAPRRSQHAFRHTFAVNYLRRGGSVFHLQKVLGHSSLEMTRRYANLMTEDLQAVHERVSLLAA